MPEGREIPADLGQFCLVQLITATFKFVAAGTLVLVNLINFRNNTKQDEGTDIRGVKAKDATADLAVPWHRWASVVCSCCVCMIVPARNTA